MSKFLSRIGRFSVVGLVSNVTLYLMFLLLLGIGTIPVLATGIVYVVGTVMNYVLHRQITFADKRSPSRQGHGRDPWRFGTAYGAGLIVSLAGMAILAPLIGPEVAQIIVIVLGAATIFTILNLTGFGSGDGVSGDQ